MAVEFEGRAPNISIAKFGKMPPQRKIGMVWRRNSPLKDKYYEKKIVCEKGLRRMGKRLDSRNA